MEIAKPSISEGLKTLINAGVGEYLLSSLWMHSCAAFAGSFCKSDTDEIVCHPYFLSPGRHVKEDIPKIVDEAIFSLKVDIPVETTDPIGSNTKMMIEAIHSLVEAKSPLLRKKRYG